MLPNLTNHVDRASSIYVYKYMYKQRKYHAWYMFELSWYQACYCSSMKAMVVNSHKGIIIMLTVEGEGKLN